MTALVPVLTVAAGVFGLAIGSFLNVVVHRVPAGLSVVRPASACPGCGHTVRRRDNVPVVSWLLLGGRCRDCGMAIAARYPLVEAGTAVLFAAVALFLSDSRFSAVSGDTGPTGAVVVLIVAYSYLMATSVALALIDIDTHRLPNVLVLPASLVLAVLFSAASAMSGDWGALLRGLVGAVLLAAVYLTLALLVPGGMGFGDVKLAGVLGLATAYLGWGPLAVGSFAAFLLGGTFAIVLMVVRRTGRRTGIPFGPWMLGGAWIGITLGAPLWDGYVGLLGFP